MEELRPEELEELVQELEGVSGAEEAPLPEVEQLLQDLEPERPMELKVEAVRQLGELTSSSPQIVEALASASMWDASPKFRRFAAASLLAPAHQAVIEQHPGLLPQHVKNLLREIEEGGLEEAIVEPEAVEEGLDEAPSVRIDAPLHALQHGPTVRARARVAERLGQVDDSNLEIVESLIAACQSPSGLVSAAAAKSLRAPVHQVYLQRLPELAEAAESALQQAPDTDWLEGTLSGEGKGTSVQRRIYPGLIRERPLGSRILGVLVALIGLGLLILSAAGITWGIDLEILMLGFAGGLGFTFAGLYLVGLDLQEFVLGLLHRRAWQGPHVTAHGLITNRHIEEHEGEFGGITYTSHIYWITFGFPTTEGPIRLTTTVDERIYGQLKRGQPVKVRYAQEDPRLALLEWE